MALPRPRLPPVMTAVFPVRNALIKFLSIGLAGLAEGFEQGVGHGAGAVHVFKGDVAGFAEGFDGEIADADEALAEGLGDADVAHLIEHDVALGFADEAVFVAEDAGGEGEAAGVEADVLHGGPEIDGDGEDEEGKEFNGFEALGLEENDDGDKENGAQDVPENDAFDGGANDKISHAFSLTETVGGVRVIVQESLPYDD